MGTLWSVDPLGGMLLRYAICVALKRREGWRTISEIVAAIEAQDFTLPENASKVVSDALRWEVKKGRVLKFGRGQYAYGRVPRSTEYRMRQRLALARGVPLTNSLQRETEVDSEFVPESIWITTAGGRRALDLEALEAYEEGRGRKTLSR